MEGGVEGDESGIVCIELMGGQTESQGGRVIVAGGGRRNSDIVTGWMRRTVQ